MSVDTTPIIISAPAGGLGRHLAALVDYAVNPQTETLALTKTKSSDIETNLSEFLAPTVQPLSPLQFWDWNYTLEGRIPVYYSTQSPTDIAKTYPNARIVQVTTTADDAVQMSYNYLVVEQWRTCGSIADVHYIREIETFIGESNVSLEEIFSDSQFIDNVFVQLLIERVAQSKTIQKVASDSRADLTVEFNKICCPANTVGNADIQPLVDFLGEIDRAAEVPQLWHTFIRSLHHAKRNILNTANWS
jgi:hypothetical protein